jgi:Xaa-Pro aminopeptidase
LAKKELTKNTRQQLEDMLPDNALCILFSGEAPYRSKDQQYPYSVNRNFYYATGLDREQMILLISKRDGKATQTLFIERPDPLIEKWTGIRLRPEEAQAQSGIDQVLFVDTFNNHLTRLLLGGSFEHIFLDLEQPSFDAALSKVHRFSEDIRARYPYLAIHNIYPFLGNQRIVKQPYEIDQIRKAIAITKDGIENLMTTAHPGVMEYELEAEFDRTLKAAGVKEHAFSTIMAGGKRATVLHYVENDQKIEDGDLVLADLGAGWSYYSADITRTFPVTGKFSERQRIIYEIVLQAQAETIAAVRPGVTFAELNNVTKSVFARELKKIGLIQQDEEVAEYYYHSVSHSLGLDTHDVGDNTKPIQAGYVITIEPGLYIAEESIGIRIEDDVLVTNDGCENLSQDILKSVDEIEAFMAAHRK